MKERSKHTSPEREKMAASLERRYAAAAPAGGAKSAPRMRAGGPMGGQAAAGGRGMRFQEMKPVIRRLMKYIGDEKLGMTIALCCVVVTTLCSLAASYMLRPIINTFIAPAEGQGSAAGLAKALGLMLVIYLIGVGANYMQSTTMVRVAQRSLNRLRGELFSHMEKLPVKYYDTHPTGDLMSRYTNDVDNIGNMLSSTLVQLFSGILSIIGTFCLMLYTNVWLTLITVVLLPLMLKAAGAVASRSQKFFGAQQKALGAANGYIEEMVSGQKVIKVFNHEQVTKEEFDILNENLRENQIRAQFYGGVMGPVMSNISQINYALTACIGGMLCVLRGFDIGGLTVFLNYSRQFSQPINSISMNMSTVFAALAGAERVFAVLDEPEEAADAADAHMPEPMEGYVKLEHVDFGYRPGKLILKDINVYAKPGQKIAFVGSTGAGKTTITNLINRFYDINSGSITIDGVDIRDMKRAELRRNIAMVLQDTHLFTGTVRENIRYGRLDASDEEVEAAAKLASAHSFIMRLPHGYDTMLEGDGANLSQGQRQLLNIARAAVSKAPVLILDEATSSVDTKTERHIEHGMERLMQSRTTLVIAHRLSTVRNADAIMVLENGVIIERGTNEELLEQKGRYYELYTGVKELD